MRQRRGRSPFYDPFRSLIRASAHLIYSTGQPQGTAAVPDDARILENMVTLTNNYVARTHYRASMFASLFLGVLSPATGSLIYVNGGHESPQILGPNGAKANLEPTGPVVGLFPDMDFKILQAHLEPGDTLYAFTDGVVDAQNSAGEMFGRETLHALLTDPVVSASALLDLIESALNSHVAGANQYDDITMLGVRRLA
ncbi:MAG: serine/threonine-protein phosphatase [Anaerolineales bacterium]|nr:serine/threonine-protein phosphatase [Anaerolineales bacterium]